MTLSLNSTYNLKAVLNETGIKPDVLRAWERRYGVPMPQRTAGGHRLYSEHDIEIIKWLMARQNEGLNISGAVGLWKENLVRGYDPLAGASMKSSVLSGVPDIQSRDPLSFGTSIDQIRSNWLEACMNFNEIAAEQVLTQAFSLYPVEAVCEQVLQRGMVDIGRLWYENKASIQQEHFASALSMRRIDALIVASPAPTRGKTIIICCPANEWHAFTTLLMALFVRRRGFNVVYLGANVPSTHLAETVKSVKADMVVLASQQLITAASLQESAKLVSAQGTIVAFGGRIFAQHAQLADRISGNYLGSHIDEAINKIETLLSVAPLAKLNVPQGYPLTPVGGSDVIFEKNTGLQGGSLDISGEYEQVLRSYTAKRSFVEANLDGEMLDKRIAGEYFSTAHKFMGDNIIAALHLGNMSFLDSEIDWLTVMVKSYHLPTSVVSGYLEMYKRAVQTQLGEHAGLIVDWFDKQLRLSEPALLERALSQIDTD